MSKFFKRQKKEFSQGFTLIEILVVVTLIIIVVGVSGDIIVSLVRSYNKTQIQNEIEQNLNFVMAKIEKDLRNANEIEYISADGRQIRLYRRAESGSGREVITYSIEDGSVVGADSSIYVLMRNSDIGIYPISNYREPFGITFTDLSKHPFSDISAPGGPRVVQVTLTASHIGGSGVAKQFTSQKTVTSTVVLRGTY